MRALELRIPPPAVAAIAAGLMWLLARALPEYRIAAPGAAEAALLLAFIGLGIELAGLLAFRRARTTINPLRPVKTTALVADGIYRRSRNPMYLGMLVLLLAWTAYLSHPAALLVLPGFVLYLNRFQIEPEERVLRAKFGADFERYCATVRRWI